MAAGHSERCRNPQRLLVELRGLQERQRRLGQRAGLVEYNRIYIGQPLQRRRGFQQHACAKQRAGGDHLNHRYRQGQRAGAGDDQHCACNQQRLAGRDAGDEEPPHERQQRGQVHRGCVAPRHTVGEHHEARAARLRRLDQAHAFGEQRGGAGGGRAHRQCCAEVQRAGENLRPRRRRHRQTLARHKAGIERRRSAFHDAIDADALAEADDHALARGYRMLTATRNAAIRLQHRHIGGAQRQQLLGCRSSLAARAMVEETADQQKEQQCNGGIKIRVRAALHGLREAHAGDQDHADADRHVHVGTPTAQRGCGCREEWPPGIGDRRHGDQRRYPVQQVARRRAHVVQQPTSLAGPDADRHQHYVDRGEACNRESTQQRPSGLVLGGGE